MGGEVGDLEKGEIDREMGRGGGPGEDERLHRDPPSSPSLLFEGS